MNNIYIFGEIHDAYDAEWIGRQLEYYNGQPVTIHINSNGGSVFSAIAIANAIKAYPGEVTANICGICASAAVLISSACKKVQIAANSLMMTHAPSILLNAQYNGADLDKMQEAMSKLQEAIDQTIKPRLKKELDLTKDTWFNAQEAVEYGLADEITGAVDMRVDAAQGLVFVNKMAFKMQVPERLVSMDDKDRIKGLLALKGTAAADAIVDVALMNGDSADKIKPYIEAISKVKDDATEQIKALIRDQLKSGAEGVFGGQAPPSEEDIKKARIEAIANLANGMV